MNIFEKMSDDELHVCTIKAAQLDRQAQLVTITHLVEVDSRRLYSKLGYSSIFSYAVTALGFSEPAAGLRIQAMRLAKSIPLANIKIQSGQMSVSSAASVQQFIRKEEKANSRIFSDDEKERIISEVSGKSARETQKILLFFASHLEPHVLREKIIPLTPSRTQFTFYVGPEIMKDVERVRELKGELSLEEIFKSALSLYLDRTDLSRRLSKASPSQLPPRPESALKSVKTLPEQSTTTSESNESRYVPVSLRQALQERSGGCCEFISSKTGLRCESRFRLTVEHRIPFSQGGATDLTNCLYYCSSHNLTSAIDIFGDFKMKPFLRS